MLVQFSRIAICTSALLKIIHKTTSKYPINSSSNDTLRFLINYTLHSTPMKSIMIAFDVSVEVLMFSLLVQHFMQTVACGPRLSYFAHSATHYHHFLSNKMALV